MRASRLWVGLVVALALLGLGTTGLGAAWPAASTPGAGGAAQSYPTTFAEVGLPAGTSWSVHLTFLGCGCDGVHGTFSGTGSSIVVPLTNGSYRYSFPRVTGYYVVGLPRGSLNVSGAAPGPVDVQYDRLTTYPVQFHETGLPGGRAWTIHLSGNGIGQLRAFEDFTVTSSNPSIFASLPNGSYRYTIATVNGSFLSGPAHGTFVVAGLAPSPISVPFVTPATYAVSFSETGLLTGMSWSVAVHGVVVDPIARAATSPGPTNTFYLPNGTFHYRIATVLGYAIAGAASGTVVVAGAPVSMPVAFTQLGDRALFLVDFNETGLANGTTWTVHVAATHDFGRGSHETASSTGSTDSFALQNATYRYQIVAVRGYTLSSAAGTVTVAGVAPPAVDVTYAPIPVYTVTFNETGLANGTVWSVLVKTEPGHGSAFPVHTTTTGNATELFVSVPDGSYCYRFLAVPGYTITAGVAAGTFVVSGSAPSTISVTFSPR